VDCCKPEEVSVSLGIFANTSSTTSPELTKLVQNNLVPIAYLVAQHMHPSQEVGAWPQGRHAHGCRIYKHHARFTVFVRVPLKVANHVWRKHAGEVMLLMSGQSITYMTAAAAGAS